MPETRNKKLKISQMFFLSGFLVILGLFISQEALAAACVNVPLGGNYTVTTSCTFPVTVDGVENGNLTINSGETITINAGYTVVWNSGYSVIINGSIAINKGAPGGQLRKTYIWLIDSDNDGYPTTATPVAQNDQPAGGKRRSHTDFTTKFTYFTDITYDYSDADSAVYPGRCCNGGCSINQSTGLCELREPGEVGCTASTGATTSLPACKRCDGTSLPPVNFPEDTQDTEGVNRCDATCQACKSGSCSALTPLTSTLRPNAAGAETNLSVYRACADLDWTRLYAGAEEDYFHTVTMPGDGSLIRLRVMFPADSRKLYSQRVTNPGPGSNFSTWTYESKYNVVLAASCANGANVSQVYINSSREIHHRESTTNGASWGSWGLKDYTPTTAVYALAVACKPNGDLAIFFADQATLYVKERVAGAWQSKVAWGKSTGSLTGIAVVYDADWNLLITGMDTEGNYKIWKLVYGDGGYQAANTWSSLIEIKSAPATYEYNAIFMDKIGGVYRAFYTEYSTADYIHWVQSSSGPNFINLDWCGFEGFDTFVGSYGLAVTHGDTYSWLARTNGVWRAPTPPPSGNWDTVDESTSDGDSTYAYNPSGLGWTRLYTGAEGDYFHSAAMPGDGSLIRLKVTLPADSRKLYYQRVTNPGPSSDFSPWTYLDIYNVVLAASCAQSTQGLEKVVGADDVSLDGLEQHDLFYLVRYQAVASRTVTQIRIRCFAAVNVKVAIYADASGEPGALLNAVNDSKPCSAGWNTISFPDTAITSGTYYWLAFIQDANQVGYHSSYAPERSRSETYSTFTFPNPAGTGFSSSSLRGGLIAGWGLGEVISRVYQVYINSNREIRHRESTDNGASWGSWSLLDYTPTTAVYALAAAYKPNGDLAIFFADQATLYVKERVAGAWQSKVAWTKSTGDLTGVAVVYDADWNLLITGKDSAGDYKIWKLVYGDGGYQAANTWSDLIEIKSAPATYEYKAIFMDKIGDVYRAYYTEKSTADFIQRAKSSSGPIFINLTWSFSSFDTLGGSYGLAVTHDATYVWLSRLDGVWRAPITPSWNRDLYALPDPGLSGPISGVTVYVRYRATQSASAVSAKPSLYTYNTPYDGTEYSTTSTAYGPVSYTRDNNPNTGVAWTWAEINALQVGVNLWGGSNAEEVRCTQVYCEVSYCGD